jgi:PAS domain S-box-containing protein
MPQLVFLIDREKKIRWMNSAARRLAGGGAAVDGFCYEMPWCHSRGEYQCSVFYAMESGKSSVEECCTEKGRWLRIEANPVKDESGQVTGVVEIIDDVTERKMADKTLAENQKRLEMILNGGNMGFWDWDLRTGHITCNRRYATMLGYNPEDFILTPDFWKDLIHPDDFERVMIHLNETLRTRSEYCEDEYRMLSKTGHWKWILNSGMIMDRNSGNEPLRMSGILMDIDDRKRAEEEISRLNEELEKRVESRTRELEDMNRELKDFAYVVSHDLKAPLRGISQLSAWLRNDYGNLLDADGMEKIELIISRVKRMNRLIDGILHYSSVGRSQESSEAVDCNILVRELAGILLPAGNTIITIEGSLPLLYIDRFRLEQVFQNLLSNAIRYMDKDVGSSVVACIERDGFHVFSGSDNGPGVDPRYHDKIFQIFQTLAPRDEHESTGIGLALVKKIVSLFGGDIRIESEVGNGSTFYFTVSK